jgi:hypothetical protein
VSDLRPSEEEPADELDPVAFVEAHRWTFAKTMADIPHEYVVRGKRGCDADAWDRMAELIRENGYWARWTAPGGRTSRINVYLELGDHKYWVIYPVINRELKQNSTTVPLTEEEAERAAEGAQALKRGESARDVSANPPKRGDGSSARGAARPKLETLRTGSRLASAVGGSPRRR